MRDWRQLRLASFDIETTGLDCRKNRITEIGIVVFEERVPIESYSTLINPKMKIEVKASEVSGITNEMVENEKPFSEVAKKIRKVLSSCDLWCAFNETFDRSFVMHEFKQCNLGIELKPVLDARIIADFVWPQGPNHLDNVVQRLKLSPNKEVLRNFNIETVRHRALYDALLCGMALYDLAGIMPVDLNHTLIVQYWMYKYWLKFTKQGEKKYTRELEPLLPEDLE